MLKAADAVRFPTSEISTQYLPAFSVTLICGEEPATAEEIELASAHVGAVAVPPGVPIPRPTATVEGGPMLVSVMVTVPAWATVIV
jgi:hypothetical protein